MFSQILCQSLFSKGWLRYVTLTVTLVLFSGFNVVVLSTEFNTLHHPSLRQAFLVTEEYHYVNVPRVGTYIVFDDFDCTYKCLRHPSCLSLNLGASKGADGKLWCELLSSVEYKNTDDYKRNDTSHHFSIMVGQNLSLERLAPCDNNPKSITKTIAAFGVKRRQTVVIFCACRFLIMLTGTGKIFSFLFVLYFRTHVSLRRAKTGVHVFLTTNITHLNAAAK